VVSPRFTEYKVVLPPDVGYVNFNVIVITGILGSTSSVIYGLQYQVKVSLSDFQYKM